MDQRLSGGKPNGEPKSKLPPLPPSDDEYFTKDEADTYQVPSGKNEPCRHEFKYASAGAIECGKCRIGLYLDPGDRLRNGHLYRNGKLVI